MGLENQEKQLDLIHLKLREIQIFTFILVHKIEDYDTKIDLYNYPLDLMPYSIGKIIRSTKRTINVVLLDLPTNKKMLYMQMWHHLVIFYFLFLVLIRKPTHTFA